MNSKLKHFLSITTLIIILGAIIYYILTHLSDFKQLSLVNPLLLILLVIFILLVHFSNGLIIKYLLEPFKLKIKFKEWFGLAIITNFYNTIFPFRGGLIAKAAYLKKKHSFPFTNFIAMMAGIYVINFLIAGLIGMLAMLSIYLTYGIFNIIVFLIFLFIFFISALIIIFSPKIPETKNKFINNFVKVINGWHLIKGRKKIIAIVSIIAIFQILIGTFTQLFSYNIFGIELGFIKALLLASIGPLLILVAITPAGLGINEAVSVFLALTINIPPVQSLTVAILNRVVGVILIFILGPVFSYKLLRGIREQTRK